MAKRGDANTGRGGRFGERQEESTDGNVFLTTLVGRAIVMVDRLNNVGAGGLLLGNDIERISGNQSICLLGLAQGISAALEDRGGNFTIAKIIQLVCDVGSGRPILDLLFLGVVEMNVLGDGDGRMRWRVFVVLFFNRLKLILLFGGTLHDLKQIHHKLPDLGFLADTIITTASRVAGTEHASGSHVGLVRLIAVAVVVRSAERFLHVLRENLPHGIGLGGIAGDPKGITQDHAQLEDAGGGGDVNDRKLVVLVLGFHWSEDGLDPSQGRRSLVQGQLALSRRDLELGVDVGQMTRIDAGEAEG
mmetsp:Transcript_30595/g.89401  ORF Transcript_30595/g.89401 Transcript_30595/m.89401 type:complete len:304 (-) Transcript_30595:392-1303(-)